LFAVTLAICLFNNLTAGRYLLAAHWAVALILALALSAVKKKHAATALILTLLLLGGRAVSHAFFVKEFRSQADLRQNLMEVLDEMKREGLKGAYAGYDLSWLLTFFSGEEIIVAPLEGHQMRYPKHREYVASLRPEVFILPEDDPYDGILKGGKKIVAEKKVGSYFLITTES